MLLLQQQQQQQQQKQQQLQTRAESGTAWLAGWLSHGNELGVSNECRGWGDRMVISDKTDIGDIKDGAAKWLK